MIKALLSEVFSERPVFWIASPAYCMVLYFIREKCESDRTSQWL